jgi:DNA topoisomerase-1
VESPTKSKTLKKFLGRGYEVIASGGHIKDLPKSRLGVDIENNFRPEYITIRGKTNAIKELKQKAENSDTVYLAPDPDREGEAIAYHIALEISRKNKNILRATFNEITKGAVLDGIKNAGKIDLKKVYAQQARRILDRLVGYQVSPLLWEIVMRGLSAGRVQSVALKMICSREDEIEKFVPVEYWSIDADFEAGKKQVFTLRLWQIDGLKFEISTGDDAAKTKAAIESQSYRVKSNDTTKTRKNPPAPFITSSLQQDAFNKLHMSNKVTMAIAQQLYEGVEIGDEGQIGLITYMRTDSVRIASEAAGAAKDLIIKLYGDRYIPEKARVYKSSKSAQDAHEAIRPTAPALLPKDIKKYLSRDQYRLYELIWSRFMASQMAPAEFDVNTIEVESSPDPQHGRGNGGRFLFRGSKQKMTFDGYTVLYNGQDDVENNGFPPVKSGDNVRIAEVRPEQHFTEPPPRFNAGSLVKELEQNGIGRPSTYAQIISVLLDRKYVTQENRRFAPTDLGRMVNKILIANFPDIFSEEFTARMESELDKVEDGSYTWVETLNDFYGPFKADLDRAILHKAKIKKQTEEKTDEICEKCGSPMVIKIGKNGKFLACSAYPKCKNTRSLENEIELTGEDCPNCGSPMQLRRGRFGRFIACSNYPECKTTKNIPTGVKCPEPGCGGDIVERTSRKGKVFFSCSNYPKCEHSSWYKPVDKKCDSCGFQYMVERTSKAKGDFLACPKCKATIHVEIPQTVSAS